MTVRDLPLHWEIEEDDYGELMVFHRHVDAEYPAYIIGRGAERQVAQCSNCMQYLELVGTTVQWSGWRRWPTDGQRGHADKRVGAGSGPLIRGKVGSARAAAARGPEGKYDPDVQESDEYQDGHIADG